MEKITEFTKENLKDVRQKINEKLAELNEIGINLELANISYDSTSFSAKIKASIQGSDDEFKKLFIREAKYYDMNPTDIGRKFMSNGKEYIFRGFKPRARKNIVIAEAGNGQLYRMGVKNVKTRLGELT